MATRARVIIVHGAFGSPQENWFPWLKQRVEDLGHEALVPVLPTPDGQTVANWTSEFARQCGPLTRDTVLVGHSLGPAFILALLERSPAKVLGTFLVSGFLGTLGLPEFDAINEPFVCRSFDWNVIRANAGSVHIYNSDSDPYVPLERGQELATHLGVELTVLKNAGHVNASAGFTQFPRLLDDLTVLVGNLRSSQSL